MYTIQELKIILQLISQATDASSAGKIILGQLQAKTEALLSQPTPEDQES